MSVLKNMEELLPELTKSERKAAEYILSHPIDVVRYGTSDAVGSLCGCSRNSVIRLSQKLGFKGFSDFKVALARELNNVHLNDTNTLSDLYIKSISEMKFLEHSPVIERAAKILKNADRIYSYGYSHSNYSSKQFMFRMMRNGYPVAPVDPVLTISEYASLITNRDALVIFSISGGYSSKNRITEIEYVYKNSHPNIILFTMSDNTPMEKYADVTIKLPCVSRMTKEIVIDDAPIFFIGIEYLISALDNS